MSLTHSVLTRATLSISTKKPDSVHTGSLVLLPDTGLTIPIVISLNPELSSEKCFLTKLKRTLLLTLLAAWKEFLVILPKEQLRTSSRLTLNMEMESLSLLDSLLSNQDYDPSSQSNITYESNLTKSTWEYYKNQ